MGKLNFLTILSLIVLFFSSCEKLELGEEITVVPGKKYNVSWNLSFTIDSINEYRCPIGVLCFWAGDVDLFFNFNNGGTYDLLNLNNRRTNPYSISGYTLEILDVNPYPEIYKETDPEDITVNLKVTRK